MLRRLLGLYGNKKRVETIRKHWVRMREEGNDAAVDAQKERYCRRMYNLSQFVKTLKERIAQSINRANGHVGNVFEGRFHSGLVQDDIAVKELVTLYIDYNPHKAHLVNEGESYRWSSFGQACSDGPYGELCRKAYEHLYGCSWREIRERTLAAFRERLPNEESFRNRLARGELGVRPGQLVQIRVTALTRGAFIGRSVQFGKESVSLLKKGFPHPSFISLTWLERVVVWPNRQTAAA